ncbi:MAG: type II toxin-antitoxin system VapC family toxin [Lachnospiraceae bacterium]|nr:type II toxin-antitoxin system VapC family toxin [Lachnospiraceae bacterium]
MLDTNILIFCMRHPDSMCASVLAEHIGKDVCISVVTYAELEYGIMNSKCPERNREAINKILAGIPILAFDINAAVHFGQILAELKQKKKDKQNQDRDKMIAAHARALNYVLITDNIKDFVDIEGLQIDTWRQPGDIF